MAIGSNTKVIYFLSFHEFIIYYDWYIHPIVNQFERSKDVEIETKLVKNIVVLIIVILFNKLF